MPVYMYIHVYIYILYTPESCREEVVGHNSFRNGKMEEKVAPAFGRQRRTEQSCVCCSSLQLYLCALGHKGKQKRWRLEKGKVQ